MNNLIGRYGLIMIETNNFTVFLGLWSQNFTIFLLSLTWFIDDQNTNTVLVLSFIFILRSSSKYTRYIRYKYIPDFRYKYIPDLDTSTYQILDTSTYQILDTSTYQVLDTSTYQILDTY